MCFDRQPLLVGESDDTFTFLSIATKRCRQRLLCRRSAAIERCFRSLELAKRRRQLCIALLTGRLRPHKHGGGVTLGRIREIGSVRVRLASNYRNNRTRWRYNLGFDARNGGRCCKTGDLDDGDSLLGNDVRDDGENAYSSEGDREVAGDADAHAAQPPDLLEWR